MNILLIYKINIINKCHKKKIKQIFFFKQKIDWNKNMN